MFNTLVFILLVTGGLIYARRHLKLDPEPDPEPAPEPDPQPYSKRYPKRSPKHSPESISDFQITIEILIGLAGWYLVNGLFWLGARGNDTLIGYTCPGNFIVLLICVINPRFRMVATGILIALALNFVASLLLGMMTNAFCFVPFFNK
jgi:hypothetical protein